MFALPTHQINTPFVGPLLVTQALLTIPASHASEILEAVAEILGAAEKKNKLYTLPKTDSSPPKIGNPKRKMSFSDHPFSGAKSC